MSKHKTLYIRIVRVCRHYLIYLFTRREVHLYEVWHYRHMKRFYETRRPNHNRTR